MKKTGIQFPKSPTPAAAACAIFSALALAIPSGAIAAHGDYIALKYIYMDGGASSGQQDNTATHYIDTRVVPSGNWSIEASFASTNTAGSSSIYSALFCARGQGNANAFVFWPHVGTSDYEGQTRFDVGSASYYSSRDMKVTKTPIAQCTDYAVAIKESDSGKIAGFLNDTRETDEQQQFGSTTCPLVLFSAYSGATDGTYSKIKFSFEGWFYYLKALDGNGDTQLDIVPAKRKSDDAIGVYDRARGLFFVNQGSGAFTAGQANLEIVTVKAYGRNSFEPVVMNNGIVLVEGTDYTSAVATDDDGVKALSVTGIGNYAGATATAVIQSRIDSEDYTELAWIRTLGKVSIRPSYAGGDPIVPRGDWDIEMAFTPEQKTIDNANYSCLLSARLDSTTNGYAIMFWNTATDNLTSGRYGRFDYQGNVGQPACGTYGQGAGSGTFKGSVETPAVYADVALASAYGTRHLFALKGGEQYLDGQLVFDGSAGKDFTAGGRLTLFTSSTGETDNTAHSAAGIFHRLSIKDANGVPQLELIPAKRLSNGTIGVYDTVNSKFYPNGDYKSFGAGPEAIRPIVSRKPLVISVR